MRDRYCSVRTGPSLFAFELAHHDSKREALITREWSNDTVDTFYSQDIPLAPEDDEVLAVLQWMIWMMNR
jgi:hypothetical protein